MLRLLLVGTSQHQALLGCRVFQLLLLLLLLLVPLLLSGSPSNAYAHCCCCACSCHAYLLLWVGLRVCTADTAAL
jgi:hypothetical protein